MIDTASDQPAFPRSYSADGHNGMTLRDWFAGQAMASIPNRSWDHLGKDADIVVAWATLAYAVADAMLQARRLVSTQKEPL
jgi:hypothetical protein